MTTRVGVFLEEPQRAAPGKARRGCGFQALDPSECRKNGRSRIRAAPEGRVRIRDAYDVELTGFPSPRSLRTSASTQCGDTALRAAGVGVQGVTIAEESDEPDYVSVKCLDPTATSSKSHREPVEGVQRD